jgi:hypothetical protein
MIYVCLWYMYVCVRRTGLGSFRITSETSPRSKTYLCPPVSFTRTTPVTVTTTSSSSQWLLRHLLLVVVVVIVGRRRMECWSAHSKYHYYLGECLTFDWINLITWNNWFYYVDSLLLILFCMISCVECWSMYGRRHILTVILTIILVVVVVVVLLCVTGRLHQSTASASVCSRECMLRPPLLPRPLLRTHYSPSLPQQRQQEAAAVEGVCRI